MARLSRYFVEGQPQSLIHRSQDKEWVFLTEVDYQFYYENLLDAADRYGLAVHAYILMPDHVHLLATPKSAESLPRTLQSIGRRYTQYFNNEHAHTGALWEGRYRATIIDPKQYLLTCMRYVELNPVRAEFVTHPRDYGWSSYGANAQGEEDPLVRPHRIYRGLGRTDSDRQKAYRTLFRSKISSTDLELIRDATNKAWVLGDQKFRDKIETASGRRASPRPKGRPRKDTD